jgi:zinc protease
MRFLPLSLLFLGAPLFAQEFEIPYEKHTLSNGLDVILHEDHSDPLVSVYLYYHVGSGREVPGRSGFAHLFEHMLFQGSANVGDDQHFKLIQEAGGTLNGTTNTDRTNYYETLPSNQLELALWLESDRMGFLLPSVTQEKLDNQRDVVKNERRQRYENRPYGRVGELTVANLYPPDHTYNWTTIGSMEDLSAASLEDIHTFFKRWYGPNNATIAIGGDIDSKQALALVKRYFGDIPRGPVVGKPKPRGANLTHTKYLIQEDNVQLPQLTYTWPTVGNWHPDEAALDLLSTILSGNQAAVFDKALTVDEQIASYVNVFHPTGELAGSMQISLRPNPGLTLNDMETHMLRLLEDFAKNGIDADTLQRVQTEYEAQTLRRFETVSQRTSSLGHMNCFTGDPSLASRDIQRFLSVTPEDIKRVANEYLINKPAVVVSCVPMGEQSLALSGRKTVAPVAALSNLDRKQQPAPGPRPTFSAPDVWEDSLPNGIAVMGSQYNELPMTQISLCVPAGRLLETKDKLGLASFTASMMREGTQEMTSTELTEALQGMGASLSIRSDDDEIRISLSALDKHLPRAIQLLEEVLLRPRFEAGDFDRLKSERLVELETRDDQINSVAADVYARLLHGDTVLGAPSVGTTETVGGMSIDDVKNYWKNNIKPGGARLVVVGKHDTAAVREMFKDLSREWLGSGDTTIPASFTQGSQSIETTRIFLVDKPGAAQSQIRIGHLGIASNDSDFYPAYMLNYVLGGSFSSRINMNLREDKGYTYGARSSFRGGLREGPFTASAGVRTDVTAESVVEFMKEINGIQSGVTEAEVNFAKDALIQAAARQYESMGARARMIDQISQYGYEKDFVAKRLAQTETLGADELKSIAAKHVKPGAMVILVVGDKATVMEPLSKLGYGDVIELDTQGNVIGR